MLLDINLYYISINLDMSLDSPITLFQKWQNPNPQSLGPIQGHSLVD